MTMHVYRVIRESIDGTRGKRAKLYSSDEPLRVGGLYPHLGEGFPGLQRVLELVRVESYDD